MHCEYSKKHTATLLIALCLYLHANTTPDFIRPGFDFDMVLTATIISWMQRHVVW
jgi:hypothetical protein